MADLATDLKPIIDHALRLGSPVHRARYLAEACGDDARLRAEVDSLLWAHEIAGNTAEMPSVPMMSVDDPEDSEGIGSTIGPYKLMGRIGRGGMGVVYRAEQSIPIRREVALKVIRPEMASRQVVARFEAERQALALMDHPNIARVLDAGATSAGQPYFVMELVRGVPITEYCDRGHLGPRERMALMVSVCQAIQHAHQKGIIHRDIKPSNVLVTTSDGQAIPKVIDFGVAKAVDRPLTERTLLTHHGSIVGTLEYMSPEQAESRTQDVDTRSDVYSLGVLVYELLTGTTPLGRPGLEGDGFSEILRRIREEEPPSPSSRIARGRTPDIPDPARARVEPAKLARLVRGELDWIALKALEKDRTLRYETPNDLARDLRRHLDGEAIEAGPPSATYRLRKFARRHRAAASIAAAFAVVLISASVISAGQAARASREATKARAAEFEARAMLVFFRDRVLAAPRPAGRDVGLGRDVSLREALDAAEPRIAAEFAGQPLLEATVRDTLGTTYLDLGEASRAIRQHGVALSLRETWLGPDREETESSRMNLGLAHRAAGDHDKAIPLHERAYADCSTTLGLGHSRTILAMSHLASDYRAAGRNGEALALSEKVLKAREATLGPDHADTMISVNQLAAIYQTLGRVKESIPLHERDLAFCQAQFGRDHRDTLTAMNNLAAAYQGTGRLPEALLLLDETLQHRSKALGRDHPETLTTMNNLATALQLSGKTDQAIPLLVEVVGLRKAKLGPDHLDTARSQSNLAQTYRAAGRVDDALPIFGEVLRVRRARLGPGHPDTIKSLGHHADASFLAKRWPEAEALLRDCLKLGEAGPPDDWRHWHRTSQLGGSLAGQGKHGEAEPLLIDGYRGMLARTGKIPASRRKELSAGAARIVPFYESWGKPEEAGSWRDKLAATAPAVESASQPAP